MNTYRMHRCGDWHIKYYIDKYSAFYVNEFWLWECILDCFFPTYFKSSTRSVGPITAKWIGIMVSLSYHFYESSVYLKKLLFLQFSQEVFRTILKLKLCRHSCRRWDQIILTCRLDMKKKKKHADHSTTNYQLCYFCLAMLVWNDHQSWKLHIWWASLLLTFWNTIYKIYWKHESKKCHSTQSHAL